MDYRFSPQGLTFDFPNPYRVENQFLIARGTVLLIFAALLAVLVLTRGPGSGPAIQILRVDANQGSTTLPLAAAAWMGLFGIFELVRAARQWSLQFGPGQPASLAAEVHREATGVGPGAPALMDDVRRGVVTRPGADGPYRGLLSAVSRHVGSAPRVLGVYAQVRLANLLAASGLLLLLAVTWAVTSAPQTRALVAAVHLLCGGLLVLRSYRRGDTPLAALGPVALAVLLSLALFGSLLVLGLASQLPPLPWIEGLALPRAAAAGLVVIAVVEALGLYACRAQMRAPTRTSTASDEAVIGYTAEPNALIHEIDREFHRHWTEGIPNRRYAWQTFKLEPGSEAGALGGLLFEESQPMPPAAAKSPDWAACMGVTRLRWLAVIDALGVLVTMVGCVAWVRVGHALAENVHSPRTSAALGLVLMLSGGYTMRVAHRLWGRLDFESTMTCLELTGTYTRAAGVAAQAMNERSVVDVGSLLVRAWVVRARSVIFGALDNSIGSRTLMTIVGDAAAARGWIQHARAFAQGRALSTTTRPGTLAVTPGSEAAPRAQAAQGGARQSSIVTAADAAALIKALAVRANDAGAPGTPGAPGATAARAAPRYCSACGTPVLAGARFCQQCGTSLLQG